MLFFLSYPKGLHEKIPDRMLVRLGGSEEVGGAKGKNKLQVTYLFRSK